MLGLHIFNQCHGLFSYRQFRPRLVRGFRLRFRLYLGERLQNRLSHRQHHRRRRFGDRFGFYYRFRDRFSLNLWLIVDGFLRLFAQPSEQAFFLASRSWGLLVVVGTKHGDGYLKVATRHGARR